jgi:pyruvate kinase
MPKEILCTLGPASLDGRIIRRLEQSGANLFRINLSHTRVSELPSVIEKIRAATTIPICLDTEGAQIRTGTFVNNRIMMRENSIVRAHLKRVPADDKNFNFYPLEIVSQLEVGDIISIDFNAVLVQVISVSEDKVSMRVLQGGLVGQNKAVTVERNIPMPPLTEKDRAAIKIGMEMGLTYYALSFANGGSDVEEIRQLIGEKSFLISKIETRAGLDNVEEIGKRSDALLIDRGDLSRHIPIEILPQTQKNILHRAQQIGCKVYVATNLLESMVSLPVPTRAEVNDIYNTLVDGADGLVLAAETAIGQYPIQCASMIRKIIQGYEREESSDDEFYPTDAVSLLVEPHGGRLVHHESDRKDIDDLHKLPVLKVDQKILMDCEQIGYGTFSPITGFMNQEILESVLEKNRLPGGEAWTLPILLQTRADAVKSFGPGIRLALADESGDIHAILDISEIYKYDLKKLAKNMYGTTSSAHPGVHQIYSNGDCFIGGDILLLKRMSSVKRHYLLTPVQTRYIFTQLGWSQVIGFHGRNPAHRGHESIQLQALERTGADGLYINPVIGPKKSGDFLPDPILLSYQTLLEFGYYPKGKVVLGSFLTYPRYAGPREAVFTALCRKNMGCSHFIIGRDHAGVGKFYEADATRKLFDSLGDIGVKPVFFETIGYNTKTCQYETDKGQPLMNISGTEVRENLRAQKSLPDWFMHELVQEVLLAEVKSGRPIFYE